MGSGMTSASSKNAVGCLLVSTYMSLSPRNRSGLQFHFGSPYRRRILSAGMMPTGSASIREGCSPRLWVPGR